MIVKKSMDQAATCRFRTMAMEHLDHRQKAEAQGKSNAIRLFADVLPDEFLPFMDSPYFVLDSWVFVTYVHLIEATLRLEASHDLSDSKGVKIWVWADKYWQPAKSIEEACALAFFHRWSPMSDKQWRDDSF